MNGSVRRLLVPAASLTLVQVLHGAVPSPAEEGGWPIGPVAGLMLLLAAAAATAGAATGRGWARPLLCWTGYAVATGFVVYHVVPVPGPLPSRTGAGPTSASCSGCPSSPPWPSGSGSGLSRGSGNGRSSSGLSDRR